MRCVSLLLGWGLVGCGNDSSIKIQTSPPVVAIQQPTNGSEVTQGTPIQMRGLVEDPLYMDDLSQLQVSWAVGGSTVCEEATLDLGGNTTCEHTFMSAGEVLIDLQVISPNSRGSATNTVLVVSNFPPEAEIISPDGIANYYSDYPITFEGIVSDNETAASELQGYWSSSLDGDLAIASTPDQDGYIRGEGLLSQGSHTITFTAFESETRQGTDSIIIDVGGENQLPSCSLVSPVSGGTYSAGEVIEFSGQASDPDIPNSELVVQWKSNIDGSISETPVDSDGTFSTGIASLTDGPHTITLSVFDEVGGSCTDSIDIIISSRPDILITAPVTNEIFNEGSRVDFQAEVSDGQDQPQDLLINWSSSIDSTFSTQAATSNGIAVAHSYLLTPGMHSIELTVTDTDGYSSTDQVTIQINALPETPEVSLTPSPLTSSDDISVNINTASVDPEGNSITYSYYWTKNTQVTTHTSAFIPFSDTTRGEVWEVYVTPNDGYGDGEAATASVTVVNSPPLLSSTNLSLSSVNESGSITCSGSGEYDEDGDTINLIYAWEVNGTVVSSLPTIDGTSFNRGDTLQCLITPNDGTEDGLTVGSDIITVLNSAPSFAGAELTPTTAYEKDTLTCVATGAADPDGDDVSPIYSWTVNGATISSTGEALTGSFFDKDDVVTCHVTPNDGSLSGATVTSNSVTITNTAPELTTVELTPLSSYEDSTLSCTPQDATDDDGDALSFSYDWIVKGESIGLNVNTLNGTHFDKNDTVSCKAKPNDGTADGPEIPSINEITIENTPPTLEEAVLSSPTNDVTSTLTCTAGTTNDIDPADSITLLYAWKKNGVEIDGETGSTLQAVHFSYEDEIVCLITPTDGFEPGAPKTSNSITISNAIPSYTNPSITPTPSYETSTLTCNLGEASDPDGQNVTPTYVWYLNDTALAGLSSPTLTGEFFNKGDKIKCSTIPNDGVENGVEVFSGEITIQNSLPTANSPSISPTTGKESTIFTCSENGGADADPSDSVSLSYGWKVNGANIGQAGSTLNGAFFNKGDIVKCFAIPNDGSANGPTTDSIPISIDNSSPIFESVSISPIDPETEESISSSPTGWSDDDGDNEDYTYQWYNQDGQISGATGASLSTSKTQKGDVIYLQATAFDGTDLGVTKTSNSITVVNTAPEAPVVEIQPVNAEPEDTLTCEIVVPSYEADNDTVTYSYQWYRDGDLQPDFNNVNTVGSANTDHQDQWTCTVTPYDGSDYGPAVSDSQVVADVTDPDAPVLDAIDLYRNEGSVTINGSAEPNSILQFYSDCSPSSQTVPLAFFVPASGAFSAVISIDFGTTCSYYARATDAAGNTSDDSNTVSTEYCDPVDVYEISGAHDGNTCSNAIDTLSILGPSDNASVKTLSGNVVTPEDEDWYVVDTSQDVGTSGINYYNFQVELTTGSAEYDITVYRGSCAGTAIQIDPDGETSYDSYNFFAQDKNEDSGHLTPPDSRYCQNNSRYNNCDDLSDVYYIKVHRVDGKVDCSEYTLSVQNGYPSSAPN